MVSCEVCIDLYLGGFEYESHGDTVGIWRGPWHNVMCQQLSGVYHYGHNGNITYRQESVFNMKNFLHLEKIMYGSH